MATTSMAATGAARSELETSTVRAISWRLIPFLVLAYFFSYLDRVNLGFAALTMNAELKFSPLVFAWGAGIFFIGYFIFEVPSNLALEKFGASRWIARIMVTWGIISALMATVHGEVSFYVLRFLLGVAEAGFFPGIILYLTYWFPAEYRARFMAAFAIAVPVSTVIGAPISGLLLGLDGVMGLKGWQWLFIIEGVPSMLLGIVTWFYLADKPEHGNWLSAEQKAWLATKLNADYEKAAKEAGRHFTLGEALASPKVITLSLIYFGFVGALYGMQFWLPQIVKAFGFTNAQTGFVTAVPYLFGTIAMILWARHSDATRERVKHVGAPFFLTAIALAVSSYLTDPTLTMVALTLAAIGVFCIFAVFWTLPTAWLSGTAAAIALINSIGNLAGFGGPYLIGWVKEATGSTSSGLLVLAVLPLIGGLLVFLGGHESKVEFVAETK